MQRPKIEVWFDPFYSMIILFHTHGVVEYEDEWEGEPHLKYQTFLGGRNGLRRAEFIYIGDL